MKNAIGTCTTFALAAALGLQSAAAARQAPAAVKHALLIGVTKYPALAAQYQLEGPLNDVGLVRTTLSERLGVSRERIVELTEDPAASARPTRANIQREFERLAAVAGKGDQVLILFAGHGSQQPDGESQGRDEDDGLDEIFLPADAAGWDGAAATVTNAVVDDEIGQWLNAIRRKGAFVWIVFDACQSSTGTRGDVERTRQVPASALIPPQVLARVRGSSRGAGSADGDLVGLGRDAGAIAALYAAQTTEPTPEKRLPDAAGPVHGLFTYTLVEVLSQSTTPISYRDLVERIGERYRAMGRGGPTPGFEGGGLDEPVFDMATWAGRSRLLLGPARNGRLTLRAGRVHGLTRGSVLRLFPPAGSADADRAVGHLRVTSVDATSAIVEPMAFGERPAPEPARLVPNSRAEVAFYDYGEQTLKVSVHPDAAKTSSASMLAEALRDLSTKTAGLAERVETPESSDWLAAVAGGELVLSPASGWRVDPARREAPESQTPFRAGRADPQTAADAIASLIARIARARTLMQIAATPPPRPSEVAVEIELIRYTDGQDKAGAPVQAVNGERTLRAGDEIAFRLRNSGNAAADVTLLFIDSQYGIAALFPRVDAESDGRLDRGATIVTPRMTVTDDTVGLEQVVAIAVQAATPRVDFRYFEQPSLDLALTRGAQRGSTSPLERLLRQSMYGQGGTRGLGDAEVGRHAIEMIAWRTTRRP